LGFNGSGCSQQPTSWISCRPGFFLSVRVLSRLFLESLQQAFTCQQLQFHGDLAALRDTFPQLLTTLGRIEWVVYAKPPFGGPQQVIDYLGRYTHRVAIDNRRIEKIENDQVRFQYKDYRSGDRHKSRHMSVSADEFIRRFLLYTLPPGFPRIRHYGLLASRNKKATLQFCRSLLDAAQLLPSAEQIADYARKILAAAVRCPICGIGEMIRVEIPTALRWRPDPITVDSS
jgi:hypothetical protein